MLHRVRPKNAVHGALRSLGFDIHRHPVGDEVVFAEQTTRLFEALDVNCVLDVGANDGDYAAGLRSIGYRGRIISFEPVAEVYQALERRASGDDGWHVRQCALGSSNATAEINVTGSTTFTSFLTPSRYGEERFAEKLQPVRTETVRVWRLDTILDECISDVADPRIFLKVDTQGWDLEVLAGATGVMNQILGLQSEISVLQIYKEMVGYLEAIGRMQGYGFDIVGLIPVSRDGLRVIEFDCLMVGRPSPPRSPSGSPA